MFIEPYLGNVTIFAGNFAPRSWMFCQGQLLAISQYDALFALLGTTYGGDGQATFALPDLRGRCAVHAGQGQGLSVFTLGEMMGAESVQLLNINLPVHNHPILSVSGAPGASNLTGTLDTPVNNYNAKYSSNVYNTAGTGKMIASPVSGTTPIAGGSQPVTLGQPSLAMNYIIAVEGIFPSRN